VRTGEAVDVARERARSDPQRYVLVTDAANRPLGWLGHDDIPAGGTVDEAMANPVSPLLNKRTTLKDALSMMLDADVQTGVVVDRTGAVQGVVTVESIAGKMREGEHALVRGPGDDRDGRSRGRWSRRADVGAADEAAIVHGV
jgi:osmoprotectant transport system ATP-binding protein